MKARLAAVLSIVGVLAAGSAAAVVNTRVLESDAATTANPTAPGANAVTTSSSIPPTIPPAAATTPGTTPATTEVATTPTVPVSNVPTAPAATQPPATEAPTTVAPGPAQATFALGPGGSVTLGTSGGALTIVRVDPAPGWEVHDAKNETPTQVRVRVRSDRGEVRLEASLVFGVISTSLEEDLDG